MINSNTNRIERQFTLQDFQTRQLPPPLSKQTDEEKMIGSGRSTVKLVTDSIDAWKNADENPEWDGKMGAKGEVQFQAGPKGIANSRSVDLKFDPESGKAESFKKEEIVDDMVFGFASISHSTNITGKSFFLDSDGREHYVSKDATDRVNDTRKEHSGDSFSTEVIIDKKNGGVVTIIQEDVKTQY